MEDRELIRCIQNGQKEYLNTIAEKYYDDVYYFCCYQTGSREDSYDLAQETFLRFIRYSDKYRYRNLKGYLLTIAMNLCRSYFRQNHSAEHTHTFTESADTFEQERTDAIDSSEKCRLLADALLQLPDMQREAVLLHHFYGYKNREIARMTGASYTAVKSRINQGLEKLQHILDKEDFYET